MQRKREREKEGEGDATKSVVRTRTATIEVERENCSRSWSWMHDQLCSLAMHGGERWRAWQCQLWPAFVDAVGSIKWHFIYALAFLTFRFSLYFLLVPLFPLSVSDGLRRQVTVFVWARLLPCITLTDLILKLAFWAMARLLRRGKLHSFACSQTLTKKWVFQLPSHI